MRLQIAQPPSDQQYQRNQVLHFPMWSERFQITHLGEPTPAGNHAQTVVVPRTDSLVVRGESNAGSAHIAGSSATITRSPRAKGSEQWVPRPAMRQRLEQHKGKTFRCSDPAVRSSWRAIAGSTHLLQPRGDKKKNNQKTPRRAERTEGNANDLFR